MREGEREGVRESCPCNPAIPLSAPWPLGAALIACQVSEPRRSQVSLSRLLQPPQATGDKNDKSSVPSLSPFPSLSLSVYLAVVGVNTSSAPDHSGLTRARS